LLLALLGKRQDLKLAGVLGMRPGLGGPVSMAEALLQLGRPLVQGDRSGMCRQLPALGERRPHTSTRRALMRVLGPIRCLAGFLADATNLRNGLVNQLRRRANASSRASSLPRMAFYHFG
jgi:hypothetical protein